jgi:hypothetical protein
MSSEFWWGWIAGSVFTGIVNIIVAIVKDIRQS